jgi:hypothetical protein
VCTTVTKKVVGVCAFSTALQSSVGVHIEPVRADIDEVKTK